MPYSLLGRSFLKEIDFTPADWRHLLALAADLKAQRRAGAEVPRLTGRQLAIVFEKASTRTRCALESACREQGMGVTYLDPSGSHMGYKETVRDTARVLGRMYDAIAFRGAEQATVEELAAHAGVPVVNGLTAQWHPSQSLCDVLTMQEHAPRGSARISFAFIGDARYNMGNSLLLGGALAGMDVRIVSPQDLTTSPEVVAAAERIAAETGATITHTDDPAAGVRGVDFIHTDVWVSMGEAEELWKQRAEKLADYRVTAELMAAAGNPRVKFMHCLPSFHNRDTALGEKLYQELGLEGLEVTDDVFESPASIVFDQAENRLHTLKAVLVALLAR